MKKNEIGVTITYPDTIEGMKEFENRMSKFIADVILFNINKLDRTPEYKAKMIEYSAKFIGKHCGERVSLNSIKEAANRELIILESLKGQEDKIYERYN